MFKLEEMQLKAESSEFNTTSINEVNSFDLPRYYGDDTVFINSKLGKSSQEQEKSDDNIKIYILNGTDLVETKCDLHEIEEDYETLDECSNDDYSTISIISDNKNNDIKSRETNREKNDLKKNNAYNLVVSISKHIKEIKNYLSDNTLETNKKIDENVKKINLSDERISFNYIQNQQKNILKDIKNYKEIFNNKKEEKISSKIMEYEINLHNLIMALHKIFNNCNQKTMIKQYSIGNIINDFMNIINPIISDLKKTELLLKEEKILNKKLQQLLRIDCLNKSVEKCLNSHDTSNRTKYKDSNINLRYSIEYCNELENYIDFLLLLIMENNPELLCKK